MDAGRQGSSGNGWASRAWKGVRVAAHYGRREAHLRRPFSLLPGWDLQLNLLSNPPLLSFRRDPHPPLREPSGLFGHRALQPYLKGKE